MAKVKKDNLKTSKVSEELTKVVKPKTSQNQDDEPKPILTLSETTPNNQAESAEKDSNPKKTRRELLDMGLKWAGVIVPSISCGFTILNGLKTANTVEKQTLQGANPDLFLRLMDQEEFEKACNVADILTQLYGDDWLNRLIWKANQVAPLTYLGEIYAASSLIERVIGSKDFQRLRDESEDLHFAILTDWAYLKYLSNEGTYQDFARSFRGNEIVAWLGRGLPVHSDKLRSYYSIRIRGNSPILIPHSMNARLLAWKGDLKGAIHSFEDDAKMRGSITGAASLLAIPMLAASQGDPSLAVKKAMEARIEGLDRSTTTHLHPHQILGAAACDKLFPVAKIAEGFSDRADSKRGLYHLHCNLNDVQKMMPHKEIAMRKALVEALLGAYEQLDRKRTFEEKSLLTRLELA